MTNWYEQNGHYLSRPQPRALVDREDQSNDLREGQRYRIPFNDKGHYWRGGSDEFWCGHGVWPDPDWYIESGAEDYYGPYWVAVDPRAGNICSPCRQRWEHELTERRWAPKKELPQASPVTAEEWAALEPRFKMEALKLDRHAAWVAAELGGTVT